MHSSDAAGYTQKCQNQSQEGENAAVAGAASPSLAILDSVGRDELSDVFSDFAEIGLDQIFEDEIVKQLPIIRSVASLVKAGFSIRDRLFARKILLFLKEVSTADQESREKFAQKISAGQTMEKAGESLLLLLDKLDDMAKPTILGRIMRAAILGEIEYEESLKLGAIVNRVYLADLQVLPMAESGLGIDFDVAESLASAGLLRRRIEPNIYSQEDGGEASLTFYELNSLGRTLSRFLAVVCP